VLDFLTARYGQFVLLKPRFGWDTALLWLAPAAVLLIGAGGLFAFLRRRNSGADGAEAEQPALTTAEQRRLAKLLGERGKSS
jgi:cytochrome c-type biogenesis protein CcmH